MSPARFLRHIRPRLRGSFCVVGAVVLAAALSACALTQPAKPKLQGGQCVFLPPDDCSLLTPKTSGGEAGLRYIASGVDWRQYTRAMIPPVAVFGDAKSKLPAAESQALADYLHATLVKAVEAELPLVTAPARDVMKIQVALTNASAAVPVLRTVSMVVPQARALATLKYIATGTYAFVGGAQAEVLVTNALTGQVLAAAVDRRVGGGSLGAAAQWEWGDAKHVMDEWSEMTATRIANLQAGKTPD